MLPKIIFAVTNDLSYDQRMIRICNSLATYGFEVLLVGRIKPQSIPLTDQKFQQIRFNLWFNKGKLFYLAYNIRLFFFLLMNRFDIVGPVDLDTLLPCFLVAKLKKKPCVFDAHEYFTEVPEVVNRPLTKRIWECLGNWIIPHLKHAYTVSSTLQELFSKKYNVAFGLIRNISVKSDEIPEKSSPVKSINKPIILYQGVLNEGRGLEQMISAMQKIPNAEFWLAGEGDLSNTLRKLVKDLALEDRIIFWGYLSPIELKSITKKATIGLNLLENKGLSYYFSLANKTFDYIHAELPAIHPNFPEYQSINKKFEIGVLVANLKEETLINAIQKLLLNEKYYKQIKANCLTAQSTYNWGKEANKLIKYYQHISSK